jgi:hypothetical protein
MWSRAGIIDEYNHSYHHKNYAFNLGLEPAVIVSDGYYSCHN